jgi:hypothetical protein
MANSADLTKTATFGGEEGSTNEYERLTFDSDDLGLYTYTGADGKVVGDQYNSMTIDNYPRGRIVAYFGVDACTSQFIIPGTQLLPVGVLAFAYALTLAYLFLGISIIAEVFMAGIEKITS